MVNARSPREGGFMDLQTNGVSIEARPFSNLAAGPFDVEMLACPACGPVDLDALHEHIDQWLTRAIEPNATCLRCGHIAHARELRGGDVNVICGQLAVTFWNWPPLDDDCWIRNVVDVIAGSLGARPSIAQAKL